MREVAWWPIYIGPQQQKEPDGVGPGCMGYPFWGPCETNSRVLFSDIVMRDVSATMALPGLQPTKDKYAGVIRCNESAPCGQIVMDNVVVEGASRWVVENVPALEQSGVVPVV